MTPASKSEAELAALSAGHEPTESAESIDLSAQEVLSMRARLQDAEDLLRAIREGEIDALAVSSRHGPRIHMLSGAEHPYAVLVEAMSEGAVTLSAEGRILYANPAFTRLVGLPAAQVVGLEMRAFVQPADRALCAALLEHGMRVGSKGEVQLVVEGMVLPVFLSFSPLNVDGLDCACLIVTDLREQKHSQAVLESQRLAISILDQAAEAIFVCNEAGLITRASQCAQSLCEGNLLLSAFDERFQLHLAPAESTLADREPATGSRLTVEDFLQGKRYTGREVIFQLHGGRSPLHMLLSAGPIRAADNRIIGCVVSLTDIMDRKRAERAQAELLVRERQARDAAQAANQAKDIFLATLSHELRTPLSAVLGWARLLRDSPKPEIIPRAVEVIERNSLVQAKLIDEILDISRIVSGKITLELRPLNLVPVVNVAIDSVRPAAEAKGLQLSATFLGGTEMVLGDAGRLQQVIWNLLTNATKFTPRGGAIEVWVGGDQHHVVITISDTGQGIAPDFLPYVFDRFRQADGTTSRRHGGLGLGLAIVHHLVQMHGGSVSAQSPGEGLGSTFVVHLPRDQRPSAPPSSSAPPKERPPVPSELKATLRGVQILLVDDQPDMLAFLGPTLTQHGAEVITASSGASALEILRQLTPDVLISDIAMPEGDGYQLVRALRAREAKSPGQKLIPAIALTAFARTADTEEALQAGFQAHIAKPVDVSELVKTVSMLTRPKPRP